MLRWKRNKEISKELLREKKGTGMSTARPPKYQHSYTLLRHDRQPPFPDANTHAALQLENCKPKSQGRYFWVQSPAS